MGDGMYFRGSELKRMDSLGELDGLGWDSVRILDLKHIAETAPERVRDLA